MLLFQVTQEMGEQFSRLTGDYSPLHGNRAFARRTVYRQPVVHGMLQLAFLPLLPCLASSSRAHCVSSLSAQFMEPVHYGETLILEGECNSEPGDPARFEVDFSIFRERNRSCVTKGTMRLESSPGGTRAAPHVSHNQVDSDKGVLTEGVTLSEKQLEDISVDDEDSFSFVMTKGSIDSLIKIVQEGTTPGDKPVRSTLNDVIQLPSLLGILLFSTSVGMGLPGKYATFLRFEANARKQLETGTAYTLRSKVAHISQSVRILKKELTIQQVGAPHDPELIGQVHVLVNPPPTSMPTLPEIEAAGLDFDLRERVVLITGASRGIGETTSKLFALLGAHVVLNCFQGEEDSRRIVDEIQSANGQATWIKADVTDAAQVHEMVRNIHSRYGRLDVLVNNAARNFSPQEFLKLTWEDVQQDVDVVIKGAFHCCQAVIPAMLADGGGKIINIGTVATDTPPPHQIKYVVAKAGLVGLTRGLAAEFAAKNIQVNMVVPSFVETDLTSHIPAVFRKKIAQDTPMQRNASPLDVARTIVFLASQFSSFTTGQKIMVTGGPPYL